MRRRVVGAGFDDWPGPVSPQRNKQENETMTYKQRMMLLNLAIYDAIRAGNDERQPVTALREMAADIDHGCTREEMRERMKAQRQFNQDA